MSSTSYDAQMNILEDPDTSDKEKNRCYVYHY